ncbi:unnamed protein product [Heterobilharzia americana]|nr:unnamed protein product [Heterobilharzia americana]
MSDQQSIPYPNIYNVPVNNRPTDAQHMAMPYFPQPGSRLENVGIHAAANSFYPFRNMEQVSPLFCSTKSALNLEEASKSPTEQRKRQPLQIIQPKADESPPPETKVGDEKLSCAEPKDEGTLRVESVVSEDSVPKESCVSEDTHVEVLEHTKPSEEISSQEIPTDFDDAEEEEGEEEEIVGRNRYSRDFVLSRKVTGSQITPAKHQEIMNQFANAMRMVRSRSNHAPRNKVIKLYKTITVKRVEGAFVPSKLRNQGASDETETSKDISRELNIILNRVSDNNISETMNDIKKLNISTSDDLSLLAKTIFQKGIRQSKYSKLEVQGSERFPVLILQLTQELFNKPLDVLIHELNVAIDAKIAAAKDESIKRMLEDDRETNILKKTESYYGNITFIAELYLCGCVPIKTITECLKKLKDSSAPEALPSLIILLNLCGSNLEQNCRNTVDLCFKHLDQFKNSKSIETHQMFKVQELIELRSHDWKPTDNTQPQSQIDTSRRNMDDKQKRTFIQPDTKRKSAQSVNPLTPSSLAVTPQSYDSRKLGPTRANWTQGCALPRPSEDSHTKQNQNLLLQRSRESSPRVPRDHKKTKPKDYDSMLEDTKRQARTVVETILRSESDCLDCIVESTRNRSSICRFTPKKILKENDIITSCANFFKLCDSDWIADYPQGWLYVAEVLHHLISGESDYLAVLLELVEPIRSDDRASTLMAHCIELSKQNTRIINLVANPSTPPDKIQTYFNKLSQRNLSKWFMQSIMPVLLKSQDQSRVRIDSIVMSLLILIDHKPDRELHVLCGFQDPSIKRVLVASWLSSLVEKKVISADALTQWRKGDSDGTINEILSSSPELRNL